MNSPARCKAFRSLLSSSCVMIPGAFNGLSARLAAQKGFEARCVAGAGVTGSYGTPDVGLMTQDYFAAKIKEVSVASGLHVLADADTGFGEEEMVAKTVKEFYFHGASGLHIEDQVFPKRCGHLDGKALVPAEQMADKIRFARKASGQVSEGQFVICARTDAKGVLGLEETIRRSKLFIDAGADMIFPEGLASKEEFALVARELKAHNPNVFLLANMTEFGKTPYLKLDEFAAMKYNCVIYPVSTLRVAMKAVDSFLDDLKANGGQEGSLEAMQTRKELYSALRYKPGEPWEYPDQIKKN